MKINQVFHVSLQVLRRHKLLPLGLFALGAVLFAALLAAEFGGRQPATLALDVGLSTLRLVLPLFLVFQVQELFSREFDRKFYQLSLSYPVSRLGWFGGRFLALLAVSLGLLLIVGLALMLLVWWVGQDYAQPTPVSLGMPLWITLGFIGLELLVLLSLACLLAVFASTPSFVLIGTLGFMLIARSYAAVIALLADGSGLVPDAEGYRSGLGVLGYLLPDLGALDLRMMALYGQMDFLPSDWPLLVAMALSYSLALLALSVWQFQRKQFA